MNYYTQLILVLFESLTHFSVNHAFRYVALFIETIDIYTCEYLETIRVNSDGKQS